MPPLLSTKRRGQEPVRRREAHLETSGRRFDPCCAHHVCAGHRRENPPADNASDVALAATKEESKDYCLRVDEGRGSRQPELKGVPDRWRPFRVTS